MENGIVKRVIGPVVDVQFPAGKLPEINNAIEVHVSFLRKKLALLSSSVSIKSLRGIGYILEDNNAKGGQS